MSTARDFGDLADLMRNALETAVTDATSVEPYAGQIEEALDAPAARFPFLTVLYTGTDSEPVDGVSYEERNQFEVGIYVQTLAGAAALKELADQKIREVKAALVNHRLATNTGRTVPGATRIAYANSTTLIYGLGFGVSLDVSYPEVD